MKTISLSKGYETKVDDVDYAWLSNWKWHVVCESGHFYAARWGHVDGKRKQIKMHRVIALAPPRQRVDHRDRDTLNNQRQNLRPCTQSQNMANAELRKTNTSGFKGVSWESFTNRWSVGITVNRKHKRIGRFDDLKEAALAYDSAAIEAFGEFAVTNKDLGLL